MKTYVLGLAVDSESNKNILLMTKYKPEWQKGFLNGVGGNIEEDEYPIQAMIREFKEETNIITTEDNWTRAFNITYNNCLLIVYIGWVSQILLEKAAKNTHDWGSVEPLKLISRNELVNHKLIHNLPWLISLGFDSEIKKPIDLHEISPEEYYNKAL